MVLRTETKRVPVDLLVPAEWNYKTEGTEVQIEKLKESIRQDQSAGVPAVRELDGHYEVIDGNHRLTALRQLGVEEVLVENFGAITKAQAVLVARRRNYQWFPDDPIRLAGLMRDVVLPEMSLDEMAKFMPETREELEALTKMLDFDWNKFAQPPPAEGTEENFAILRLSLPESVYNLWLQWKERVQGEVGPDATDIKIFEYAMAEALASSVGLSKEQNGRKKKEEQKT